MRDKDYNMNEELEQTIAHLARHMQALREAVPVNYELKAMLKKRLLEQLKNKQAAQHKSTAKQENRFKRLWLFLGIFGLLVALIGAFFWSESKVSILDVTELGSFPAKGFYSDQPVTVAEDGLQTVLEYQGSILLFSKDGRSRTLLSDREEGIFHTPSWAHNQGWFAVVHEQDERSEIWLLQHDRQYVSRLIYAEEGASFSNLHWSADDEWVIVSKDQALSGEDAVPTERKELLIRYDGSEVLRHAIIDVENQELDHREQLAERYP